MYGNSRNSRVRKEMGVEEHDSDVRFSTGSENTTVSRMRHEKTCNITLIYGRIAEISAFQRKSLSRNTMVTSDLRAEVEIWPFCAFAMHQACMFVHRGRGAMGQDTTFHRMYL